MMSFMSHYILNVRIFNERKRIYIRHTRIFIVRNFSTQFATKVKLTPLFERGRIRLFRSLRVKATLMTNSLLPLLLNLLTPFIRMYPDPSKG